VEILCIKRENGSLEAEPQAAGGNRGYRGEAPLSGEFFIYLFIYFFFKKIAF